MAKIKVHAGDFLKGDGELSYGSFTLKTKKHSWMGETISMKRLSAVEIASEENVKRIGGTIGWGVAGAAILGPVGLLAGLLAGGRGKDITFIAQFSDGRKFLGTTDSKTFTEMKAVCFGRQHNGEISSPHGPLRKAVYLNRINEVKELLSTGEDPNKMWEDGKTALSLAKERGHSEIVHILEEAITKE